MKNILRKALCLFLAFIMLVPAGGAVLAAEREFTTAILFDNEATNEPPNSVTTEGSYSARIVEDGRGNKAYFVENKVLASTITIPFEDVIAADKYIVQADFKYEGQTVGGKISLINNGKAVEMISIQENGRMYMATDNKFIGAVNKGGYTNVAMAFDNEYGFYSVIVNGRHVFKDWTLNTKMNAVSGMVVEINETGADGTGFYIDNVAQYEGERFTDELPKVKYNPDSVEYIPVDESSLVNNDQVYLNINFDDGKAGGITQQAKTNKLEVKVPKEGEGYLSMQKNTSDDIYVDYTFGSKVNDLVVQTDVCDATGNSSANLTFMRDTSSGSSTVTINGPSISSGALVFNGGTVKLKRGTWYNVAMVIHFKTNTFDVYVDGEKLAEGKPLSSDFKIMNLWRIYIGGGTEQYELLIDNMRVYSGTEPRDISDSEAESRGANSVFTDNTAKAVLTGKNALSPYGNYVWQKTSKHPTDVPCINVVDESLVSPDTFKKFTGRELKINGNTATTSDGAVFTLGSTKATIGGKQVDLKIAPQMSGEHFMVPVYAYCENALEPDKFFNDDHGLLMIGPGAGDQTIGNASKEANLYMFFDRPSPEQMKADMLEHLGGDLTAHPRIWANADDFTRLREKVKTDKTLKEWLDKIIAQADDIIEKQSIIEYKIDNGRFNGAEMFTKARPLGFAYQMTGDEKYAERLAQELMAGCSFETWHPDHSLDSGTMSFGVALGFDWIYDYLTEEQRQYIAERSKILGVDQGRDIYNGTANYENQFWVKTETNWGLIVNGGYATLILATAEYDTDEKFSTLYGAMRSMEYPWYRFAPDGAWYEGAGYWGYMTNHHGPFMAAFESCMGYAYGKNYMGLDKFPGWQMQFIGPDYGTIGYHDGGGGYSQSYSQTYFARLFDQDYLMKHRLEEMKLQNVAPDPIDFIYADTSVLESDIEIEKPLDAFYREIDMISMREGFGDPEALWVATHGGASNNAHDHLDVGTYVFTLGGVRWAIDYGSEEWSYVPNSENPALLAGYSPDLFYRQKAEGHNMIVIDPGMTEEYLVNEIAYGTAPVGNENGAYAFMDNSAPYKQQVDRYVRGYLLDDGRRSFTVRDEISLKAASDVYWFMQTYADIEIVDNDTAILYEKGRALKMEFVHNIPNATLTMTKAEKLPTSPKFKETKNNGAYRVMLHGSAPKGDVNISVKMSLLSESDSQSQLKDMPLSQWSLDMLSPAANRVTRSDARLSAINLDGSMMAGFNPEVYNYSLGVLPDSPVPVATAVNSDGTPAKVRAYTNALGSTVYVAETTDSQGRSSYYTIEFLESDVEGMAGYTRYDVAAVDASSEQQDEPNYKGNSADGNLSTRWSAQGDGEWLLHDLGESKQLDAVGVALWMGYKRKFYFDIEISDDAQSWTKVGSFTSNGETEEIEIFKFDAPVNARYIRYVGHGSSANEWNNVIELCSLKKK